MNALAKAHQQMRDDGAPPELLRGAPQVPAAPSNSNMPVVSEATAIVQIIERMARDVSLPLDRLEKVIELQERLAARQAETAFNQAMAAAQAEMQPVRAESDNPQTRSKYASYAALDRAVRPIYTKHGFALTFNTGDAPENHVRVLCDVSNGAWTKQYRLDMPADGKGARGGDVMTKTHATMSAVTYGKRGILGMVFNLAVSQKGDDDGNAAGDGGVVSEDQALTLLALIAQTKTGPRSFCNYFKITDVERLPAKDYGRAVEALEAKMRKS